MRAGANFPKALLFLERVDFRKWIRGLVALIEHEYRFSPFEDCLFIFISRDRRAIKALYWDKCGFALWTKRLERERFPMPRSDDDVLELTPNQIELFLSGFDIFRSKPHEILSLERYT